MGKSKFLYALSETLYFYDLGKPVALASQKEFYWDTETELFKTHKAGTVPVKSGRKGSVLVPVMMVTTFKPHNFVLLIV
jgi:hypothetical protein